MDTFVSTDALRDYIGCGTTIEARPPPVAIPQLWRQDVCKEGVNPMNPSHDIT